MISEAVIPQPYVIRSDAVNHLTDCVVERSYDSRQVCGVLDKKELLAALEAKGVRNAEMERALGLPSSRVTEIRWATPGREPPPGKKPRELTYDEGVKLARAFGLEQAPAEHPLPEPMLQLAVRWIAGKLSSDPTDEQVEAAAKVLRAFARQAADPKILQTLDAAEGFFRAMDLRFPELEEAARSKTDRDLAH